ncbi:MAG: drug/metabolite transporter (DMT)-like permease [Gammaproteobacteria bacterium]|jgi:drug/metabolite transporter (DMT)-like permease
MELWIPITIFAAFAQNLRFMLQKHLKDTRLSTGGATFSRFVFAAPLALLLVAALIGSGFRDWPGVSAPFFGYAAIGGLGQISGTMLVVALFAERNFTVGITLKKTETMQTALLSMIILGEMVSAWGLIAIAIGLAGVVLLADPPKGAQALSWKARLFNKASGYGLAAGLSFGVSATGYRGASLLLDSGDFLIRAAVTLAFVTLFQSLIMALWLRWREVGQVSAVMRSWRVTALVGLSGVLGSFCWFMAFTLQNAAYVKALGQIELVFTFLASWLVFKEKSSSREMIGIALVVASILLLVLFL